MSIYNEALSASDVANRYLDPEAAGKFQYYMGARYHDATYGRFTQVDPVGATSGFGYAANNPLVFGDPSGQDPIRWLRQRLRAFVDGGGYVDVNGSLGAGLGVTGGVMVNREGFWPYFGGGAVFPAGFGGAVTTSKSSPTPGWNFGVQAAAYGASQVGYACCPPKSFFVETGIGSLGASATWYHVWRPWCPWCR